MTTTILDSPALVLRTCDADGLSYGEFRWPLEVGAVVEAPDWSGVAECGHGLHGLLWGEGSGSLLNWNKDARWLVVEINEYVDLDDKIKFPRCTVKHVGDRLSATKFIADVRPGAIVGAVSVAGDRGTATAGYRGTATAGDGGTATAGDGGTATAGYRGTATAGYGGTATVGYGGTATAGYDGMATAGYRGTATAGYRGTATAGYGGTATVGYGGTATAGDGGTATAGYGGTATAGDDGTATAGGGGTATAGYGGTATAGYRGTATAGGGGVVICRWWDGANSRFRFAIGYVGEDGIEAGKAYRADEYGKLVLANLQGG